MARLGEMKYEPAFDAIANRLREDPEAAAKALAKFGEPAERLASGKLEEGDPQVRVGALRLLKELQDQKSLVAVKKAARDPDRAVALAAREAWRRIAPQELTPIDEAVLDLDAADKDVVLKALGVIKDTPVDPTRQAAVARRLFDVAVGGREQPIPDSARLTLETWADGRVKDLAVLALRNEPDDSKRAQAILLVTKFNDARAVRPLCELLASGRSNGELVVDALRALGPASEEGLMRLFSTGDPAMQATCCELWREIGTRRCFAALYPVTVSKTADEQSKKRAKETIVAITRRLNSQAAAGKRPAPPGNFPATRPLPS
jgi:HEAT repeat protein